MDVALYQIHILLLLLLYSQAYRNMDMTRERISLIFELSAIFLSFQMVLSLASAAVAWAILARISGLDPSSVMIAPRYLNLLT